MRSAVAACAEDTLYPPPGRPLSISFMIASPNFVPQAPDSLISGATAAAISFGATRYRYTAPLGRCRRTPRHDHRAASSIQVNDHQAEGANFDQRKRQIQIRPPLAPSSLPDAIQLRIGWRGARIRPLRRADPGTKLDAVAHRSNIGLSRCLPR